MAQGNNDTATAKSIPPYVSFKTLDNFLSGLRSRRVPMRIDRSLMANLSGAVQNQLLTGLRYLGLVDSNDVVLDSLRRLVRASDEERPEIWREILLSAYPFLFEANGFDLATGTAHQFEERFRATGAQGDTVRKTAAFFLAAAKEAQIPVSPYIEHRARSSTAVARPSRTRSQRSEPRRTSIIDEVRNVAAPAAVRPSSPPLALTWEQMLLDKFPAFDPSWPDDVKAQWFDGFGRLMELGSASVHRPLEVEEEEDR